VKSREFSYPKPRAILTWQASAQDQARLSLTREIAQLDFAEFASSINVIDAFSIIGNPDLEPEKTWRVRGEWERRFGKRGALTLAVFHDRVEDVQDLVVIGANDAYGNLGDGTRTGVELRGAAPLDAFGLRNADLRFSGLLQETEVDDPVTGAARPFSNERDWSYNITVRQQFPEAKWAWGGGVRRQSERIEFKRIEDILQDRPGETVDLFAESTAIKGLTIRVSVNNIFSPNEERVRTFYAANPANLALAPRATGVVARTETRKQKGGPEGTRVIGFRVSGTF
jgi:outer membrane receptor protein involved in Fe transport